MAVNLRTEKTSISKNQYLQLIGLSILAKTHNKFLEELAAAANEITGEKDETGITFDMIYNNTSPKDVLKSLDISVIELKKVKKKI